VDPQGYAYSGKGPWIDSSLAILAVKKLILKLERGAPEAGYLEKYLLVGVVKVKTPYPFFLLFFFFGQSFVTKRTRG
jgi:hypothetical protein